VNQVLAQTEHRPALTANQILDMARDLDKLRVPYGLVTVVRAIAPTSAYVGAQAIVLPDGTLHGWIGGGCAQDIVIDVAQAVIRTGEPKLVRISNDRRVPDDDIEQRTMSCASNGTMELFIHPFGSGAALCVLGTTPAADEARFFADRLGIRMVEIPDQAAVVLIATQGQGDETALESALSSSALHVLMIASRRKAQKLRESMTARGIDESQLARLQAPAGQDVGAQTPAEIALVAVAAVLGLLRASRGAASEKRPIQAALAAPEKQFINPVCGKAIDIANPRHVEEFEGTSFYFCCDGCWDTFRRDPAKYAAIHQNTRGSA
jgi:xanthine dehydrogenase accessory factor